jgi:hypothetical protein
LAALLAGAGVIHLALAPSHLGEAPAVGVGFVVAGWVQIGLAVLAVTRPARWVLRASVAAGVVLVALWAVSRTAGLPLDGPAGDVEAVSLVDGLCVALEALAAVLAAVLLARPVAAARSAGVALAGVLGALVLTTAAIASPSARDHGAGHDAAAGGADHGHAGGPAVPGAAPVDDLGFSALQNGQMGAHEHGHEGEGAGPRAETIDPQTAGVLAAQLAQTAPLVQRYPTMGAAKAAGYRQAGPFAPGLGIHFGRLGAAPAGEPEGRIEGTDLANPMLIFDGVTDDAPLAGFMYNFYGQTEPEGFAGPLDRWHFHTKVCIVQTPTGISTPFGADVNGVTNEMCAAKGGRMIEFTGYMVHVWTVPGYESRLGTFSDLNPAITCKDGTYHTVPISELGDRDSICTDR